jgi:hypothetical protein
MLYCLNSHFKITMKTKTSALNILVLFAVTAGTMLLAACASAPTTNTKSFLSAAGFRIRTPETPQQKEIYAALPAYKVERAVVKGKVFYVFKDEKAGVAYVGHEPEYQRYKQLCEQKHTEPSLYMSEDMDRIQSHRFYGEWGAAVVWR